MNFCNNWEKVIINRTRRTYYSCINTIYYYTHKVCISLKRYNVKIHFWKPIQSVVVLITIVLNGYKSNNAQTNGDFKLINSTINYGRNCYCNYNKPQRFARCFIVNILLLIMFYVILLKDFSEIVWYTNLLYIYLNWLSYRGLLSVYVYWCTYVICCLG